MHLLVKGANNAQCKHEAFGFRQRRLQQSVECLDTKSKTLCILHHGPFMWEFLGTTVHQRQCHTNNFLMELGLRHCYGYRDESSTTGNTEVAQQGSDYCFESYYNVRNSHRPWILHIQYSVCCGLVAFIAIHMVPRIGRGEPQARPIRV